MGRVRLAAALLAMTALAGCGQPPSPQAETRENVNVLAAAAEAAQDAGTVRFRMVMQMPTPTSPIDMTADGEMDLRASDANMTMIMTGADLGETSLKMEIRMTSEDVYMHMPFLPPETEIGPWFHTTVEEMGRSMGMDMSGMMNSGSDPSQYLDVLREAEDIKNVGTETIRGLKTTHYRATIDLGRFTAEVAQGPMGDELKKAFAAADLPIHAWIDAEGRPVRQTATIDYSELEGELAEALPGRADFSIDYLEWGVPVEVKAPPASETSDFSKLEELGA